MPTIKLIKAIKENIVISTSIYKLFIKEEVSLREFLSDSNISSKDSTVLISILSKL